MSKKTSKSDPFAEREAAKYAHPIASREFILAHLKYRGKPATFLELLAELELTDKGEEAEIALHRRVKAMVRDEQLERLRGGYFWPAGQRTLVKGQVQVEKGKMGKTWVIPEDGTARILLPQKEAHAVYQGNKVVASVLDLDITQKNIREGKLVEILEQQAIVITGRFVQEKGVSCVIPHAKEFQQDIIIPPSKEKGATDGQIVVVSITREPGRWSEAMGEVIEILGHENTPGIEIMAATRAYNLPEKWPDEVIKECKRFSTEIPAEAIKGRLDIRHLPLVTIDGEDARDFDDAVYCEAKPNGGWRLYVAIADVSFYVQEGTALDKEAQNRGNSVYFPGKVIPMLPEVLSNGLCSLNPSVDRLCMVAVLNISKSGRMSSYEFFEAVMRSHARLTYTKVAAMLEGSSERKGLRSPPLSRGDEQANKNSSFLHQEESPDYQPGVFQSLAKQYADILPHLKNLFQLYSALREERQARGAIDFETIETRVIFDPQGKISHIQPVQRNEAHRLIEECMLCANVATARFLKKHKLPGLYRIHEAPPEDKLVDLRKFLAELGLSLGGGNSPEPLDYSKLLRSIQKREDANVIQTVLLRSLSQAVYSPDNVGHFGLAYPAYCHFTSPIRRYPDLLVHRQIRTILRGEWTKEMQAFAQSEEANKALQALGDHSSMTERRADDATRDALRWLKCEYIQKHVGEEFEGLISGVTRFGFFVELKDIYIDGLVHVTSLRNDYYFFDPAHHRLVGERSGIIFRLGDSVKVRVLSVDVDQRKIDFELIETLNATRKQRQAHKQKQRQKQKQTHKQERSAKPHPEKRASAKATSKGADKGSQGIQGISKGGIEKANKSNEGLGTRLPKQKQKHRKSQKETQKARQKQEDKQTQRQKELQVQGQKQDQKQAEQHVQKHRQGQQQGQSQKHGQQQGQSQNEGKGQSASKKKEKKARRRRKKKSNAKFGSYQQGQEKQ